MDIFLATIPLVIILVLMAGFKWGGSKAGAAGWIAALLIAGLRFGASPNVLLWAQIEGFFRAAYVLYIIWGALLFFRVTEADGTLKAMSELLQRLAPGRTLQVLLLAWGFASFLQGVGGFGVPVAVVAPILVTLGFPALDAVVMPSLGHGWAVSFGSLGASYEALISATGVNGAVIAPWMAVMLGIVCFQVGFIVLRIGRDKDHPWQELGPMISMALAMSIGQYLAVRVGVPNIAAMLGALAGLLVGALWAVLRRRSAADDGEKVPAQQLALRLLPYVLLISIIMVVNFVPFIDTLLNHWVLQFNMPSLTLRDGTVIPAGKTKAISILGHPGAQLVYAAVISLGLGQTTGSTTAWKRHEDPQWSAEKRGKVDPGHPGHDGDGHDNADLRNGLDACDGNGRPGRWPLPPDFALHWSDGGIYDRQQHELQCPTGRLSAPGRRDLGLICPAHPGASQRRCRRGLHFRTCEDHRGMQHGRAKRRRE